MKKMFLGIFMIMALAAGVLVTEVYAPASADVSAETVVTTAAPTPAVNSGVVPSSTPAPGTPAPTRWPPCYPGVNYWRNPSAWIKSRKVKKLKIKKRKKGFTAKWKPIKGAAGYVVYYEYDNAKTKTVWRHSKKTKGTSCTIKRLKKKRKYLVWVKAYARGKDRHKRNVISYSGRSAVKKVKIR